MNDIAKGKVYLVGAGPGDIGLMTVKGLWCLRAADAVVYDFHLNAQVLNYINRDAEFVYAGKRGGRHTMTQDEINAELVRLALAGRTVCRLKGGDPFVFGRGGEEAEVLAEHGIEFEIVPGISSSIAAPAYAGIPLTHRKYSSTFAVIPGYEDMTKEGSSIDWRALATGVGTLVFLMAVKNIRELTRKLIEHGRPPGTPVAVIRWGTRADQQTLTSTLGEIAQAVEDNEIRPPAVFVIGEVVRLRETLNWFERKPMFGMRVLVTREHSGGFERLEQEGAEIIEFPTLKVVPPESWDSLDASIRGILDGSWLPHWMIFTSANGVRYFFERLRALGGDIRELRGISICAVGAKTAACIEDMGIRVDLIPEKFNAEGLIEAFKGQAETLKGVRLLMPRAEVGREKFPDAVRAMGGEIVIPVAYRSVLPDRHPRRLERFLREGRITVATFTSGATFENFMAMMEDARGLLDGVTIAVIGPVTKRAVEAAGFRVDIMPEASTVEALAEAIRAHALQAKA